MGQVPISLAYSCAESDNYVSGVLFLFVIDIFQRAVRTSLEKQLDPMGVHTRISKEPYSHFWIRPCYFWPNFFYKLIYFRFRVRGGGGGAKKEKKALKMTSSFSELFF